MQNLVKDFNYVCIDGKYKLFYLGNDFKTHIYRSYQNTKPNDLIILLEDISELTKLGFRYNPYLIDNN